MTKIKNILGASTLALASLTSMNTLAAVKADMVIHNAKVYTVDGNATMAKAIAVKGNKIIYVGNDAGVDKHVGAYTQLINAKKRLVLPGLHDVHSHPLEAGGSDLSCQLKYADTLEQHINAIKACTPHSTGWILGWGHGIGTLLKAQDDPAAYLDQVSTTTPIAIMEATSHSMWVNSAALAELAMDNSTANPPGGIIVKNLQGQPNGLLMDTAGDMVLHHVLKNPSAQQKNESYQGLLWALKQYKEHGITSLSNSRLYWKRDYLDAWKKADNNFQLTARASMALWVYPEALNDEQQIATLNAMYNNNPNSFLRVNQIKMYSDGIPSNTTAALLDSYFKDFDLGMADNKGLNYFNQQRLTHYISELEKTGFDMLIHTIGDRGVRESLNAIEDAQNINGDIGRTRHHRLTHVEYVSPADINRFEQLDITADFQVAGDWLLPGKADPLEHELMGAQRQSNHVPVRDIYNTGANITLSSDWDVATLNPFIGMMHSLQRDHQSLPNIRAAIQAYTINGAFSLGQDNRVGSIEVGKLADFSIVNQDILTIPTDQISNTLNLMTILDGEVIYKNKQKW
mgnify:CR=1 FL=1